MKVTNDIFYVGVNDHDIDLFEGQFMVPLGMAYNSYIIMDDKIAVMDSVDANFSDEWLSNIKKVLGNKKPDYLVCHHMEPDHSGSIVSFMNEYKECVLVSSSKAFGMIKSFFNEEYLDRRMAMAEGSELDLGKHKLKFFLAPMVHWPEVMVSYDSFDKVLFSADAFGKFGALDYEDEWDCEARRYFFGIVGKYGAPVQTLLKKLSTLDIKTICSLHGPVLNDDIKHYLDLYNTWSSYGVEDSGVVICYTSVYGNTRKACMLLQEELEKKGIKVSVHDLARTDIYEAVEDSFRYDRLVLASTTYNGDIFPKMKDFINLLTERGYKNRKVAFIENGTWAPQANKIMVRMLEGMQGLEFIGPNVKIVSSLNEESLKELIELANNLK